ncbi:hypothetical protein KSP9073_00665 [Kushneria phyllosphaerae]|uniref:Uncharacterized protein n=1 Tax=Kushneria phyllosphaerae TaxID=2100822 RepID=A0A2R8CIU7_9GAMM|nr:hypothetical protein KSP9073_00665 [Kushneria phyllosphaerae]
MTLITTMTQSLVPCNASFVPCNVRALPAVHSASGNGHRRMSEKPFVTSTDVICIRTGERGTDAVQTPAARI